MSTSARERSAFGQFQLNRSHIDVGTDYSKVRKQASAFDMAEMLRDGHTHAEVAAAFGLSKTTIQGRLSVGGWSWRTGQPLDTLGCEPEAKPQAVSFAFIDQPWADQALCAQTDPEAFYPDKGGFTRQAKAVCVGCMVRGECLDWALTRNEKFGIWGGLSERERRAVSKGTVTTCPDCGRIFYSQNTYISHQRAHRLARLKTSGAA